MKYALRYQIYGNDKKGTTFAVDDKGYMLAHMDMSKYPKGTRAAEFYSTLGSAQQFLNESVRVSNTYGRKREGFSGIISWSPDELDPKNPQDVLRAKSLSVEVMQEAFPNSDFSVVVHDDSEGGCLHSHVIVLNHDYESEKSIQRKTKLQPVFAQVSDRVMKRNGLSVIGHTAPEDRKEPKYNYWWQRNLRDLEKAIEEATVSGETDKVKVLEERRDKVSEKLETQKDETKELMNRLDKAIESSNSWDEFVRDYVNAKSAGPAGVAVVDRTPKRDKEDGLQHTRFSYYYEKADNKLFTRRDTSLPGRFDPEIIKAYFTSLEDEKDLETQVELVQEPERELEPVIKAQKPTQRITEHKPKRVAVEASAPVPEPVTPVVAPEPVQDVEEPLTDYERYVQERKKLLEDEQMNETSRQIRLEILEDLIEQAATEQDEEDNEYEVDEFAL